MKKMLTVITAVCGAMLLASCCGNACKKDAADGCQKCECCAKKCAKKERCGNAGEGRACRADFDKCPKNERMKAFCDIEKRWAKFDSLSVDEQKALVAEKKKAIDERDSIIKSVREEFERKWADFDNLTLEEQRMLLDAKMNFRHNGRFCKDGRREMSPACAASADK